MFGGETYVNGDRMWKRGGDDKKTKRQTRENVYDYAHFLCARSVRQKREWQGGACCGERDDVRVVFCCFKHGAVLAVGIAYGNDLPFHLEGGLSETSEGPPCQLHDSR